MSEFKTLSYILGIEKIPKRTITIINPIYFRIKNHFFSMLIYTLQE